MNPSWPAMAVFPLLAGLCGAAAQETNIRRNESGRQSIHLRTGRLEAEGASLRQLLQIAYEIPGSRILGPGWIGTEYFDVKVTVPDGQEKELRPVLLSALADVFELQAHKELRTMPVFVLEKVAGAGFRSGVTGSAAADKEESTSVHWRSLKPDRMASELASWLQKPVVDETAWDGMFDVSLTWKTGDPDSLIAAARQAGLQLTPGERTIEVLKLDRVERMPRPTATGR